MLLVLAAASGGSAVARENAGPAASAPSPELPVHERIRALRRGDRYREAVTLAQSAVAENPDAQTLAEATMLFSGFRPDREDRQFADGELKAFGESILQGLRRVIARDPSDYGSRLQLGGLLRRMGRFAEASEAYAQAKSASPENAEAYFQAGYTRLYQGDVEAARREFRAILENDPGNPLAHHHYGSFLYYTGRLTEARQMFEEAVRISSAANVRSGEFYADAHAFLARIAFREERWSEAEARAREAYRAAPRTSLVWERALIALSDILLMRPAKKSDALVALVASEEQRCRRDGCSPLLEANFQLGRAYAWLDRDGPAAYKTCARAAGCLWVARTPAKDRSNPQRENCRRPLSFWIRTDRCRDAGSGTGRGDGLEADVCLPDNAAAKVLLELAEQRRFRSGDVESAADVFRAARVAFEAQGQAELAASASACATELERSVK